MYSIHAYAEVREILNCLCICTHIEAICKKTVLYLRTFQQLNSLAIKSFLNDTPPYVLYMS